MKYIIMCGGQYNGWETPRQMTLIHDEPVVARTIRLLKEAGVDDIAISTNDIRFEQFGVPILFHENHFVGNAESGGSWVEAFYPSSDPVCYLMGDVVFSPAAIKKIVKTKTDSIQFFASAPPFSFDYIKPYAEPFAFKVRDQVKFRAAIEYVKANEDTGIFSRRPIAWELWQVINGENVRQINYHNYCVINDYTCDIDTMGDAINIERVMKGQGK